MAIGNLGVAGTATITGQLETFYTALAADVISQITALATPVGTANTVVFTKTYLTNLIYNTLTTYTKSDAEPDSTDRLTAAILLAGIRTNFAAWWEEYGTDYTSSLTVVPNLGVTNDTLYRLT